MKIQKFGENEIKKSTSEYNIRTKEEIELFFIDFIDDHKFDYCQSDDAFSVWTYDGHHFFPLDGQKYLYFKSKLCYFVVLNIVGHERSKSVGAPRRPQNFRTHQNDDRMTMSSNIDEQMEVLQEVSAIKSRANDEKLDFYFNFDGVQLKMVFIER